jgi:hypothetical protein
MVQCSEPVFVNFFGNPGIDSQPGEPVRVRQPYLTCRPARLHWRAESIPGLLKRLQIRAQFMKYCCRAGWVGDQGNEVSSVCGHSIMLSLWNQLGEICGAAHGRKKVSPGKSVLQYTLEEILAIYIAMTCCHVTSPLCRSGVVNIVIIAWFYMLFLYLLDLRAQ